MFYSCNEHYRNISIFIGPPVNRSSSTLHFLIGFTQKFLFSNCVTSCNGTVETPPFISELYL